MASCGYSQPSDTNDDGIQQRSTDLANFPSSSVMYNYTLLPTNAE